MFFLQPTLALAHTRTRYTAIAPPQPFRPPGVRVQHATHRCRRLLCSRAMPCFYGSALLKASAATAVMLPPICLMSGCIACAVAGTSVDGSYPEKGKREKEKSTLVCALQGRPSILQLFPTLLPRDQRSQHRIFRILPCHSTHIWSALSPSRASFSVPRRLVPSLRLDSDYGLNHASFPEHSPGSRDQLLRLVSDSPRV